MDMFFVLSCESKKDNWTFATLDFQVESFIEVLTKIDKMKNLIFILLSFFTFSLQAQTRKLKVEPNHSTIGFRISISGFTEVTGKFSDYEINLDWNEEDITASTISAKIKAESIDTGIDGRDEHLRSADFFDVEKYPEITFESDSIQQINYFQFIAFGKFTMHGMTHNIELPFDLVKKEENTFGFRSRTNINRVDYGVGAEFAHTSMPDFLAEEIQVEIDFWTKKRKE